MSGYLSSLSWNDYVALPHVNHSRLKRLKESPWHYQNPPKEKRPSADLLFGTAFHTLLMEPARFAERYVPAPEGNKNSNAYKSAAAELAAQQKEPISGSDWARLHAMRFAVLNDPYAGPLFQSGVAEATGIFTDPETGLECKIRIDWLPESFLNVPVDLKTTRSGNPDDIRKSCWDYGYHTQAAFYSLAWEVIFGKQPEAFIFVFVEKPDDPEDTPLPPQLYELSRDYRQAGERQVRQWLNLLQDCITTYGEEPWPHYTRGLTELNAPYWAKLGEK